MPKKRPAAPAPLVSQAPPAVYDQDSDAEYQTRQQARQRRKKADRLYTVAMVVFALIFIASAGLIAKRLIDDRRAENEFAELETLIDTAVQPQADTGADTEAAAPGNAEKFAALQARNADFAGWITIEGTNLDFPVMYKPASKDYYLKHDFDGNYSNYGVPYLDEACVLGGDTPSNNLVIYGHNMKTGTIFGCLTNYSKADYYAAHPQIELDTLYGDGSYTVFAAFAIDVAEDQSFIYNQYINMDEAQFNEFVAEAKRRSAVDSGYTPVYGDMLLTLSTCEYSTSNGRYVVCAYRTAG